MTINLFFENGTTLEIKVKDFYADGITESICLTGNHFKEVKYSKKTGYVSFVCDNIEAIKENNIIAFEIDGKKYKVGYYSNKNIVISRDNSTMTVRIGDFNYYYYYDL